MRMVMSVPAVGHERGLDVIVRRRIGHVHALDVHDAMRRIELEDLAGEEEAAAWPFDHS
ncbi:MAG: hypothetical protein U0235_00815 [Polyangiaceae bacterium]